MADEIWVFMERTTPSGRGVITDWYNKDIERSAQAEFDDTLRYLAITPRDLWRRPEYDTMTPEFGEIRFKANKLEHRVFGFFLGNTNIFIMLVGATKKGANYTPTDALKNTPWYKTIVTTNRKLLRVYDEYQL
jgi:hypothetical protein